MPLTEAHFENAIIEIMRDHLGYKCRYGPHVMYKRATRIRTHPEE